MSSHTLKFFQKLIYHYFSHPFLNCLLFIGWSSHSFCFQLATYLKQDIKYSARSWAVLYICMPAAQETRCPDEVLLTHCSLTQTWQVLLLCAVLYYVMISVNLHRLYSQMHFSFHFKSISSPMAQMESLKTVDNRIRLEGTLRTHPLHPSPKQELSTRTQSLGRCLPNAFSWILINGGSKMSPAKLI